MLRTITFNLLILSSFFLVGCNSQNNLKKGDKVLVSEELRESAETKWEQSYTDGFVAVIPKGTVLEVIYSPRPGSNVFECIPVEVNGNKDPVSIERFFVPEHIRTKEGFDGYSFALKKEYLNKKLKKLEK